MKADLDPAAALIACASRCEFEEAQRSDLGALLDREIDWQRVLALAEKNYVLPLLHECLKGELSDRVPPAVGEQLALQRKFLKFRGGLFCDELVRLSRLFDAEGIAALHYKGPVVSELLYGDRFRRTYFDLDFLVRREDLDRISQLLTDQGYRCSVALDVAAKKSFELRQKEYTFVSGLLCVEPHWSLTAQRYPFPADYDGLWKRAVAFEFDGATLLTFAPRDLLIVMSVAGAKGHWKRLQMVSDIAQFYRTMDPGLAQEILAVSRELGCERIVLVAAHLAAVLLDAPVPEPIAQQIRRDGRAVYAIGRRVIKALFEVDSPARLFGDSAQIFSPLLCAMRERTRDKLRYFFQTTTTPTSAHFDRFGLPGWAYPSYRLIVPIHDYVLMPIVYQTRRIAAKLRAG